MKSLRTKVLLGFGGLLGLLMLANITAMMSVGGQAPSGPRYGHTTLCVSLAGGLLFAGVLVVFIQWRIVQPIRTLAEGVRDIEAGNLNLVASQRSRDEIGQLAAGFNALAARLREFRGTDQTLLLRIQQTTQMAVDSLPDAVVVVNVHGTIEVANQMARRQFGLHPGMLVEARTQQLWLRDLFQFVCNEKRSPQQRGYQNTLQVFDEGTERFFLPHGFPIVDPGGRLVGVTVVLVDVTQLRRLDELKNSVVATVSHELRTPLTSIRLANHLLLGDHVGTLNAKQTEIVLESRDSADRLQRIIDDLLDMSRMEAGHGALEVSPIRPHDLVADALEWVNGAAREKGINVAVEVSVELPRVQADASRIRHVISHLLLNAVRYTPPGGEIRIEAAADSTGVTFSVRDTGCGIPPEYRERVFERFFRVPGQNGEGVGLGLAIAKEVICAHRGRIEVESREGFGTNVRFTLLQAPEPALETVRQIPLSDPG